MIRRLPLVAWLALVWVALWGNVSANNVLAGMAVAVAVMAFHRFPPDPPPRNVVRPLPALAFACLFAWKLVQASFVVAWEVVTPRNRIHEGIIAIPIHGANDTLATVVANFITLTPGTLTLEFERDPSMLYVHVLHLRDIDDVRRDVQDLELAAIRAFGSSTTVRAVLADREASEHPASEEGSR